MANFGPWRIFVQTTVMPVVENLIWTSSSYVARSRARVSPAQEWHPCRHCLTSHHLILDCSRRPPLPSLFFPLFSLASPAVRVAKYIFYIHLSTVFCTLIIQSPPNPCSLCNRLRRALCDCHHLIPGHVHPCLCHPGAHSFATYGRSLESSFLRGLILHRSFRPRLAYTQATILSIILRHHPRSSRCPRIEHNPHTHRHSSYRRCTARSPYHKSDRRGGAFAVNQYAHSPRSKGWQTLLPCSYARRGTGEQRWPPTTVASRERWSARRRRRQAGSQRPTSYTSIQVRAHLQRPFIPLTAPFPLLITQFLSRWPRAKHNVAPLSRRRFTHTHSDHPLPSSCSPTHRRSPSNTTACLPVSTSEYHRLRAALAPTRRPRSKPPDPRFGRGRTLRRARQRYATTSGTDSQGAFVEACKASRRGAKRGRRELDRRGPCQLCVDVQHAHRHSYCGISDTGQDKTVTDRRRFYRSS